MYLNRSLDDVVTRSKNINELKNALIEINKKLEEMKEEKTYNNSPKDYFDYSYMFLLRTKAMSKINKNVKSH